MKKSRGAALLLALFVVSMVAVLSARMTGDYLTNLRYQRNYLYGEQAFYYLLSAEALAMHTLLEDLLEDRGSTRWHDSRCDSWATGRKTLPIAGGTISVGIKDLQARFSINSMRDHGGAPAPPGGVAPYNIFQRRFVRLLQIVSRDLTEEEAVTITQRVVDWVDRNEEAQGDGLEDDGYASLGLPYRTPNGPINSITELRFIPGIDRDLYRRLSPYIRAWPHGGTSVNINTAAGPLLRAMPDIGLRPIDAGDMEYVISERDEEEQSIPANTDASAYSGVCGYSNVGEFAGLVPWSGGGKVNQAGMTTHSSDFIVNSEVRLGDVTTRMKSIIGRGRDGHLSIIVRSFHDL